MPDFHSIAEFLKDWTIVITAISMIGGAWIGVWFWGRRQFQVIRAIMAEFKPNGGSSFRDAINRIESGLIVVDARQWAIVAGLRDPMWESDKDGLCVRANRGLLDLVTRSIDELAGSGWENMVHPDDRARVWSEWRASVERHRTFEAVYRVMNKEGRVYRVRATATPFHTPEGAVLGYVGRYVEVKALNETVPVTAAETVGE